MKQYCFLIITSITLISFATEVNKCDCSLSNLEINIMNPNALLMPTSSKNFYPNMSCRWEIQVDTNFGNSMLVVEIDSFLSDHDYLVITVCNSSSKLYDYNSLDSKISTLYTQEEYLCVYFNSSSSDVQTIFSWTIQFALLQSPLKRETINLSKTIPIRLTSSLSNNTIYSISKTNGTLEIHYYGINNGINYSDGVLFIYASSSLKNLSRLMIFPSDIITNFTTAAPETTILYMGPDTNNIVFVSRIVEYHSINCSTQNNLDIAPVTSGSVSKDIKSTTGGDCLLSIALPSINSSNARGNTGLYLHNFEYEGGDDVVITSGYNETYVLFKFNEVTASEWIYPAFVCGSLISIIIPKNGHLNISYYSISLYYSDKPIPQKMKSIYHITFDKTLHDLEMTPSYPNNGIIKGASDIIVYVCLAGVANYTITVSADVPESCSFLFYVDDQPPVEFSNTSFYNRVLQFTGANFTYIYNKTECDGKNYTGYVLQIDGHYIEPVKNKIISADILLIVGSSGGSLVVVCLIVMGFAFWYIKRRQRWYNQLFKILKEMNMSAKEISEMKAKSDELLLPHGKIHINFDEMLGKGVSSTVYKGFLMGSSPLSEQQNWPKFVDCEVAVKVSSHFGKVEVEQLFKEIDAMKKIGYHKNVMCMLGWALSGETPSLVFEIADKDLLHYVAEFRDMEQRFSYDRFVCFLCQIAEGMEYISSKGLIHRDIAARNILLFNNIIAKISDFGLCIHEDEPAVYRTASNLKLPIRWLALESLTEGIFSHKTDVWSFGILMHEMFSFGQIPYANVNNDELIVFLQSGGRLEPPKNMGIELSGVMFSCWDRDPEARPRFGKIEETLKELIEIT